MSDFLKPSTTDPDTTPPGLTLSKNCRIVNRGDSDYFVASYQYGMSTHADFVAPASIYYPSGDTADADITAIINWARNNGVAIAVRTGGHQYSAASSTTGRNVQLDLSATYPEFDTSKAPIVRMGVSHQLIEMSKWCSEHGYFLPHGLCAHVNVGGHVHSGGYGMCMRSFGLFSDHVIELEYFTADGVKRTLKKGQFADKHEEDLWFSILGGSPGNFGILTHVTFNMRKDSDYPKAKGLKLIAPYTKERTRQVCELMSEFLKADPVGLDYQITVASMTKRIIGDLLGTQGMDTFIQHLGRHDPSFAPGGGEFDLVDIVPFPTLLIYMQYGNPGGADEDDSHVQYWFNKLRSIYGGGWVVSNAAIGNIRGDIPVGVSVMDKQWLFKIVREYDYPYVKIAQNGFDNELSDRFITDLCDYIDDIQANNKNGLMQIMQLSACGGQNSQTFKNRGNGTAYAWRDCMVNLVYDVFYSNNVNPTAQALTVQKQAAATATFIGPQGSFCKKDSRFYWGSHGDRNMSKVWPCYLEPETYERVLAAKRFWDPKHVFSPNAFCVGYEGPVEAAPSLTSAAALHAAQMDSGVTADKRALHPELDRTVPAGPLEGTA